MLNRSWIKPVAASIKTHVMVVPNDGIRRTGRARVRLRVSREAWEASKANGKKAHGSQESLPRGWYRNLQHQTEGTRG